MLLSLRFAINSVLIFFLLVLTYMRVTTITIAITAIGTMIAKMSTAEVGERGNGEGVMLVVSLPKFAS